MLRATRAWSIAENTPVWGEGHGIFIVFKNTSIYYSFKIVLRFLLHGLHPGLTLHGQSALTKSVRYHMLSVILPVFYFCYFIVIEVKSDYHSFKTISPLLIGSNPPG